MHSGRDGMQGQCPYCEDVWICSLASLTHFLLVVAWAVIHAAGREALIAYKEFSFPTLLYPCLAWNWLILILNLTFLHPFPLPTVPALIPGHSFSQPHACVLSLQSCPALRSPMDCSLPGSSVHGILQAKY